MKKVMLVFGTRPEAIKICPLVNELKTRKGVQNDVLVHGDMNHQFDTSANSLVKMAMEGNGHD